jgi:hypothetical protein
VASLFSSERLRAIAVLAALAASALLAGCATVRPEDKEFLADPAMIFGSDGTIGGHDEHVLSNREGSFGGGTVTGGGCGCN